MHDPTGQQETPTVPSVAEWVTTSPFCRNSSYRRDNEYSRPSQGKPSQNRQSTKNVRNVSAESYSDLSEDELSIYEI